MQITVMKTAHGSATMLAATPRTAWAWHSDERPPLPKIEVTMLPVDAGWSITTTVGESVTDTSHRADEGSAFGLWCRRMEVMDAAVGVALSITESESDQG